MDNYKKLYLTFDLDWACDEVLTYTLDIVEKMNISATFFITHNTPVLARMRKNPKIELGIHPNFTPFVYPILLDNYYSWAEEIVDTCMAIVPEATSTRSHSLTINNNLLDIMKKKGLHADASLLIPYFTGIKAQSFFHWNGLIRVPYIWEDYMHIQYLDLKQSNTFEPPKLLQEDELTILSFHPVHIFLNTENEARYTFSRPYLQDFSALKQFRNHKSYGTENYFMDIIKEAKERNFAFGKINDIISQQRDNYETNSTGERIY